MKSKFSKNAIQKGHRYIITGYNGSSSKKQRGKLLNIGLTRGSEFDVTRMSGSHLYEIEIRGAKIAIHKDAIDLLNCVQVKC